MNCTLPFTLYPDSFLVVNAKWWASLSQEIKDIVLKKMVPGIEKNLTDVVMDDAKANPDEFVKQKGGAIATLSAPDVKALKAICIESVNTLINSLQGIKERLILKNNGGS